MLLRVKRRVGDENLSIIAAGVAFYALLATFPGLLAVFGVYGLFFDSADQGELVEQLEFVRGQLQPEAMQLLLALLRGLAESDRPGWVSASQVVPP